MVRTAAPYTIVRDAKLRECRRLLLDRRTFHTGRSGSKKNKSGAANASGIMLRAENANIGMLIVVTFMKMGGIVKVLPGP